MVARRARVDAGAREGAGHRDRFRIGGALSASVGGSNAGGDMSRARAAPPTLATQPPLTTLLLAALLVHRVGCELTQQVPSFVAEPPALVQYLASRGVRVRCTARGEPAPALAWITDDGTLLDDRPGLRRVYNNGTLEMLPTSAYLGVGGGDSSTSVGGGGVVTLRCRAANAHGVVLSRDVTLQPVPDVSWEPVVTAAAAAAGGVAALTCGATRHAQYVRVAAWYRADRMLTIDAPTPGNEDDTRVSHPQLTYKTPSVTVHVTKIQKPRSRMFRIILRGRAAAAPDTDKSPGQRAPDGGHRAAARATARAANCSITHRLPYISRDIALLINSSSLKIFHVIRGQISARHLLPAPRLPGYPPRNPPRPAPSPQLTSTRARCRLDFLETETL
ncbi:uncharacterized protein LOC119190582 [Manduca sexta]|uniref:uncharacterized protein LOC119190582 n=1 Tax=Manduca sexta TaxID=7130 RepID=UPI0018907E40|nr:uncharacterized protein LOC119190582 [Manduca sexta]